MQNALPYVTQERGGLDLIATLPPESLEPVAAFLERIAKCLRDQAGSLAYSGAQHEGAAEFIRNTRRVAAVIGTLYGQGRSLDEITRQLSTERVPPETVAHYYAKHAKEQERLARLGRDREIMRMTALGCPNATIGRRVGLSKSQVSRIVQRQLRAARL